MGIRSTTTAIIGLTGGREKADLVSFRDCGLNAVFPKPLKPAVFNEIVKRYLGSFLDRIAADKAAAHDGPEEAVHRDSLSTSCESVSPLASAPRAKRQKATSKTKTRNVEALSSKTEPPPPGAYTAAIAVVDDSKMVQLILLKRIHALGLSAVVCDNGRDLLDRTEQGELFQLILMDNQMPVRLFCILSFVFIFLFSFSVRSSVRSFCY
jgi:CheY-like chemotaxis protein